MQIINLTKQVLLILAAGFSWPLCAQQDLYIEFRADSVQKQLDVLIDGSLFTSYIFHQDLKKPVLWPIQSIDWNMLTRSYPMTRKDGDRVDHPHHLGLWLNYGDVNGLDFWNNSTEIPPERSHRYGTIYHRSFGDSMSGGNRARFTAFADWKSPDGQIILEEASQFDFMIQPSLRIIDRSTTLTAMMPEVTFGDSKEGMFAIRVARELELPSDESARLIGPGGKIVEYDHIDNSLVTGNYLSESGIEGMAVWGTRGRWMQLYGEINGEEVALIIIDHPDNMGYPTHWHARGYGLFAANPLGQQVFNKEEPEQHLVLKKGESITLKYRLVIAQGVLTRDKIDELADSFGTQ